MRFHYYKNVGGAYENESASAVDIRTQATTWSKIETGLKTEIANLRHLEAEAAKTAKTESTSKTASDGFKNKLDFFKEADSRSKAMSAAKAKVDHYREWLRREGVSADANGKIKVPVQPTLVVYDKDLEQNMTKVVESGGNLYIGDVSEKNLLDTSSMVTHFSGPGYAIYAMSAEGNLHVGSHIVGQYHHSSLLGGGKVACAGEIQVSKGKMKFVSNKSGHYVPEAVHFNQVLHKLGKMNQNSGKVDYWSFEMTEVNGKSVLEPKKQDFSSIVAYKTTLSADERSEYELGRLLAYSGHFWKNGKLNGDLEEQGWRWYNWDGDDEKPGFYDKNDEPVDHKTVRKRLKELDYQPETKESAVMIAQPLSDD
jgi:hypothetical protein